jgi:hydrogenase maturation factor
LPDSGSLRSRFSGRRPPTGKASPEFLASSVFPELGLASKKVLLGPGVGIDNAVLDAGWGRVLIVTTDPVSVVPSLGLRVSAWLSVHLVASDYATSGLSPEFASFCYNFPPEMTDTQRAVYLRGISSACRDIGVAIIAGNTGSYPGAGLTVVGGGTMFGFGRRGKYVDPTMSRPGDRIVMTKGAAIETTASLANSFPQFTQEKVGRALAARAKRLLWSCSTVKDCRTAASVGLGIDGVTAMHDATEGGVLGGLAEMSAASGNRIVVEEKEIIVSREAQAVCAAFEVNPLTSLSEGTLLITVNPGRTDELLSALRREGIEAAVIGEVGNGGGVWVSGRNGTRKRFDPLSHRDQYWTAYSSHRETAGRGHR